MDNQKLAGFLMMADSRLLELLIERNGVDYQAALKLLYTSKLYSVLEREETKLWHFSAETLYTLLNEELTTGKITFPEEQS
jgi:Holliday junction resolvasome RuvABC DNA-binding subunit